MSFDDGEEFQLVADCYHVECPSRPELHLLRHKLIPVCAGDFDLSVYAIRRKPGEACPFLTTVDDCRARAEARRAEAAEVMGEEVQEEGEGVQEPEGVVFSPDDGVRPVPTAAGFMFSMVPWQNLCFLWPLRKDSEAYRMRKWAFLHRPRVSYHAETTATGADLRRAAHESLLPDVRCAGIALEYNDARSWDEEYGTEYLQSCVTREEFEAHVAASMEALASFVDTHGGTFGAATIPGAHDPITDDLWHEHDGGNLSHAFFGTQHWWYEVMYQSS